MVVLKGIKYTVMCRCVQVQPPQIEKYNHLINKPLQQKINAFAVNTCMFLRQKQTHIPNKMN